MIISSTTNEKIKYLRSLYRDKKARYTNREYVAEGATMVKDVEHARVKTYFVRESNLDEFLPILKNSEYYVVKDTIFDSIADTVTPSGIIAVLRMDEKNNVEGDEVILLCGLSDCGNIGTIIRTACAKGIKTVVLCESADPYSPKSVRASMGGITKINIVIAQYDQALKMLSGYDIVALDMAGKSIYSYQKPTKIAIAVGSESHGVPDIIKTNCSDVLSIPMRDDGVESLNASVAAGIAMYLL